MEPVNGDFPNLYMAIEQQYFTDMVERGRIDHASDGSIAIGSIRFSFAVHPGVQLR
jgi:hypothetical protein